ncbi:MAG: PilZ domain-containing protein [Pyrinomonadaceae bacterium]
MKSLTYERRKSRRAQVQLEVQWQGDLGTNDGQMSDISEGGCFILTSGEVAPRELIRLELQLPSGTSITTWGTVIEQFPEIGFSLRFTGLDEADKSHVDKLVALVSRWDKTIVRQEEPSTVRNVVVKF